MFLSPIVALASRLLAVAAVAAWWSGLSTRLGTAMAIMASLSQLSMDWFKGKFTGKPHIQWENLWFPVKIPLNQSNQIMVTTFCCPPPTAHLEAAVLVRLAWICAGEAQRFPSWSSESYWVIGSCWIDLSWPITYLSFCSWPCLRHRHDQFKWRWNLALLGSNAFCNL